VDSALEPHVASASVFRHGPGRVSRDYAEVIALLSRFISILRCACSTACLALVNSARREIVDDKQGGWVWSRPGY
jgi:hypothetical protein